MQRFARLVATLDETSRSSAKVAALAEYFRTAPERDRVWTVALLSHRRPRRIATGTELRAWAAAAAGIPDWLFEECYAVAGDLAETIAHLLPPPGRHDAAGLSDWLARLAALAGRPAAERQAAILAAWGSLAAEERFVFNKLLTGGFRMGVSQGLMTQALAAATGIEPAVLAQRLTGDWDPARTEFAALLAGRGDDSRPYPFALASALDGEAEALGPPSDWLAEWKWDGIRAQVIRRAGALHVWTRGEELVTGRFPELAPLLDRLPDGTVIDGELLVWPAGADVPMPFAALQTRIGRHTVPRRLLAEAPVRLVAYDLPEAGGSDLRAAPLAGRRAALAGLVGAAAGAPVTLSPALDFATWPGLAALRRTARAAGAEGLMLKRLGSPYTGGRRRGDWWKWKLDPFAVDAVMVYAQAGHGRRAALFTDYTFAVRSGNELVPVAKAYSGLTDAEFAEITRWVRGHTLERFGPVRRVVPELVFEIGFEGVQHSPRHKSGVALRFPRMLRWRRDKTVADIDTLDTLRALIAGPPPGR
jgi:DNA ligase-1